MATFSITVSSITQTSARFSAKFTGGSATPEYIYPRWVLLEIDGWGEAEIESTTEGTADMSFSYTIRGLKPGTMYSYTATLYVQSTEGKVPTNYSTTRRFETEPIPSSSVSEWSWTSSNGSATATQTNNAYKVLNGILTIDNFSYKVWNDFVDKVSEVHLEKTGSDWNISNGTYISKANCKVSTGDTLSAEIYNSVKYNIGSLRSTGIADVSRGDKLTGDHILTLANVLNEIINSL